MAKVSLTLDDVILSLKKGKRVVADRKQSLSIPATVSSTGKRRNMRLDISDQGEKMLDKAMEDKDSALETAKTAYDKALEDAEKEYEKAQQKAWDELNKIADKISEIKRPNKAKAEKEENAEGSEDDTSTDSSESHQNDPALNPESNYPDQPHERQSYSPPHQW